MAVAIGTGVAFGIVPAVSASRPDLHDTLKEGTRGSTSGRGRLRQALVVTEVALSLVLLVGAGLMVRSFMRLRNVDPGYRPDHALMLRVSLPVPDSNIGADERARFLSFYDRAIGRLRQLPGVGAVGACNLVPLDGNMTDRLFDIEGYTPGLRDMKPDAQNRQVVGDYFRAVGIPLISGRFVGDADDARSPRVVVVNDSFAKRFFPRGDAIGKRIRLGALGPKEFPWGTIVGVVGDVRAYGLDEQPKPEMYWAAAQNETSPSMALIARTAGEPSALTNAARGAIGEVDPGSRSSTCSRSRRWCRARSASAASR